MARFGSLGTQYFNASGEPLVNGLIYFYESGTTTPKATYADINQTVANPNPVVLDASGYQPNIFFNGVAKAVLATSANVQIQTRDPVGDTAVNIPFQEWVPNFSYSLNDLVLGSNGEFYISLENGNIGNNPTISPSQWANAFDSFVIGQGVVEAGYIAVGDATTGLAGIDATAKGTILVGNGAESVAFPYSAQDGDVLLVDTSEPTGLAYGVLQVEPPGLALLSTVTASNSATVDVEVTFDSTYDAYMIIATGITLQNSQALNCQMKIGGSYVSANYSRHLAYADWSSGAFLVRRSASAGNIEIFENVNDGASKHASFTLWLDEPDSTAFEKTCRWDGVCLTSAELQTARGVASNSGTGALTGMSFFAGSGNIVAGSFRLYGIRKV
jgi:hypothetical protein